MKKRILSFMILGCLILSMAAGCNGGTTPPPATTPGDTTKPEGGTTEAPTEISVMIWDRGQDTPAGMTTTDNNLTKFIKESVLAEKNVKVTYVTVPRGSSDDKVNAMMAGGQAPDLIMSYNRDIFTDFATKGGLADLTAAVEAHGATIKTALGEDILGTGIVADKLYAVTAKRSEQTARHMGYIRQDWLDILGLPVPTNTKELIDTLYAFKEKDPGKLGAKLVPWGMGGNASAERYFQTFVASYVENVAEGENLWLYQEAQATLHPDAKEGFRVMNKLYNDGIIAKDFAVDTNDDKYKQDLSNGYVGFVTDDILRPFDQAWFGTAKENVPTANYTPVTAFTGNGTEFNNVSNPLYGAYNMVPKKSEAKAEAVVKYLDWLANVDNAIKVDFTPDHTLDKDGIPVALTDPQKLEKGYPLNPGDFNIVTKAWDYTQDQEKIAVAYMQKGWKGDFPLEKCKEVIKGGQTGLFIYPVYPQAMPESSKYGKVVQEGIVQLGYRSISAPTAQFDAVYDAEYQKVTQAGFDKILAEKKAFYDANIK